ncbi:TPA: DNA-binding protein, partial [Streptococcus suis]
MDSRLLQMVDEFESALMDRALKVMRVVMDEKRRYPMEL